MRSKILAGLQIVVMCYIFSCFFAASYFNWQYANQYGFGSWIFWGDIVATAKASVWPYFALRSENRVDEAMKKGKAAASKEDWDLAATEYTEAIRLDPKHAEAYCCRGMAYGEKREWDKAIADLSEAIRLNPKYGPAYFQRGCVYLGKGSPSDRSLVGAFVWGYMGRGKGDFNRAVADLTEATRLMPHCGEAFYCRGAAYSALGEKIKAEADIAEAKRLRFKPQ